MKHPGISTLLTDEDQTVLSHLKDVDVQDIEDATRLGFRIIFTFETNEWFENEQIWKELTRATEEDSETVSTASEIKWKEGKDLTKQQPAENEETKPGNKRKMEDQTTSFFTLFDSKDDDSEPIWESIRNEIWQNAIDIYYDEAYISEFGDDDDSNDEEEGDEENEEESNANEEEAEEGGEE